jgi:hypothetical protein
MSISLFVCTPAYGGNMNVNYVISIIDLERKCRAENIEIAYYFLSNESLIQRARNILCKNFIDSKFSHMIFIDADIEFNADDIIRMIKADVSVIGGVYPKKKVTYESSKPIYDYVVMPLTKEHTFTDINQPQPVKYIGTGLLLIKRHVLDDILAADRNRWFNADGSLYYAYFDCIIKDNIYLSEDYYFCEKWQELGGIIYAAFWMRCKHWGMIGYG